MKTCMITSLHSPQDDRIFFKEAIAFSSGMAAISAIFTLLKSGDHIIISENVYGAKERCLYRFERYQFT